MQGLIGKKIGMTQVYDDQGRRVAVTVVQAGPCPVVQRKSSDKDGYDAVQLGFGEQKESRAAKSQLTRFKNAGTVAAKIMREFDITPDEEIEVGQTLTAELFDGIEFVDVIGTTKGRGFAGVVKRYSMSGGRMTHGGHSKRRLGSIGQCSYPARVAKGQRMPGHMGSVRATVQNLKVVKVRSEDNVLLLRGAVPGANGSVVIIKKALKKG